MTEISRRNFLKVLGITGVAAMIPKEILPAIAEQEAIAKLIIPEPVTVETTLKYILGDEVFYIGQAQNLNFDAGRNFVRGSIAGASRYYSPHLLMDNPNLTVTSNVTPECARNLFSIVEKYTEPGVIRNFNGTLEGDIYIDGEGICNFRLDNTVMREYSAMYMTPELGTVDIKFEPIWTPEGKRFNYSMHTIANKNRREIARW